LQSRKEAQSFVLENITTRGGLIGLHNSRGRTNAFKRKAFLSYGGKVFPEKLKAQKKRAENYFSKMFSALRRETSPTRLETLRKERDIRFFTFEKVPCKGLRKIY